MHLMPLHMCLTCGMALFCIFSSSRRPCWQASLHSSAVCHSMKWSSLKPFSVWGEGKQHIKNTVKFFKWCDLIQVTLNYNCASLSWWNKTNWTTIPVTTSINFECLITLKKLHLLCLHVCAVLNTDSEEILTVK